MAKRVSSRKRDSEKVQGEGSWVELTGLKVKEMKAQRVRAEAERNKLRDYNKKLKKHKKLQAEDPELEDMEPYETDFDYLIEGIKSLRGHVLDWDWVDDEGSPLPKPQENPEVFDELTDDELTFLIDEMMGKEEVKN